MDYCVIAMPNSSFSFRLEKKGLAVQKFIQFGPRVLCQSWTTWCCCYCSSLRQRPQVLAKLLPAGTPALKIVEHSVGRGRMERRVRSLAQLSATASTAWPLMCFKMIFPFSNDLACFTISKNRPLLIRGKVMSLSRCRGLYYKLPKSDPYAVYFLPNAVFFYPVLFHNC